MGDILDRNMWHGFATGGQRPAAGVKDLKKILDNLFTQWYTKRVVGARP